MSTRSVRALWCSRGALGVPCAVSFVSGVAPPSLHRGRPSLRDDSLRPPALATTCSSRLGFPSAVALPLGEGTCGSQPQACVRCLRAARPCKCFKRHAERIQADKNGWAGSHLTSPASDSDGLVPTVRYLEGSSHPWLLFSGAKPPLSQKSRELKMKPPLKYSTLLKWGRQEDLNPAVFSLPLSVRKTSQASPKVHLSSKKKQLTSKPRRQASRKDQEGTNTEKTDADKNRRPGEKTVSEGGAKVSTTWEPK